jgi:hypothetical protein
LKKVTENLKDEEYNEVCDIVRDILKDFSDSDLYFKKLQEFFSLFFDSK